MAEAFLVTSPHSATLRALNHTPSVERFRRGGGVLASRRLGDLVSSAGPAYGAVFVRLDCDREHGVELVSQGDMFATEPSGRVIRRDSMSRPERHLIKRFQILIAAAGTLGENELYGRSIIADSRLEGKYVGPHAMALTFEAPGSTRNLYTYAVLSTGEGMRAIRSASYGTKILGIRRDILLDLPIPIPDTQTEERIAGLVSTAMQQREAYVKSVRAARRVVEALPEMQAAEKMCKGRHARCTMWDGELPTLTGWTYGSTGGALAYLKDAWAGRLGAILETPVFGGGRYSRIPCKPPHGVELLSQRDVFLIRPAPQRIVAPNADRESLFVSDHALLVAGNGQFSEGSLFGKVELGAFFRGKGITGHILRVLTRPEHAPISYAFLSTAVGQALLQSTAVGTSVPTMRTDMIASLPYPTLDARDADEVRAHMADAVRARLSAAEAETAAVRAVEEEVFVRWLS